MARPAAPPRSAGARRLGAGPRLKHSFLFEEALWRAHGEYSDASGKAAPVDGETSIKHLETRWLFEGVLRVRGERPALHHNRYDIVPFSPNARSTHWSSNNPAVGALRGRFILVGDAILSSYASPTGRYRGFETLQQLEAGRYSVRGALLEEDKVLSTWALELARI